MSIANLTTSGWVLFAITIALTLSFLVRFVTRNYALIEEHSMLIGALVVWLLYLVTP